MTRVDSQTLAALDALQLRYIDALDSQDMPGWLTTFSAQADASYLCTTAESFKAKLDVALILDDCRARLEDRVTFVDKIWSGTYQHYQTRHMVQRVRCTPLAPSRYEVKTNVIICFSSEDGGTAELLSTGVYLDQVAIEGEDAHFVSKQVITDTSVLPHYIVYPL